MFKKGDRVVVAVSGGADSVCLLQVLYDLQKELGLDLLVCHFNHGLRPDEDEEETRFVKTLAESLQLPFAAEKSAKDLGASGRSLEETARNARYAFLENTRMLFSAQKIAVGHTLDDQAETLLMRLLRGSGTSGFSGIPPVRDGVIVRPLLELTREEIEQYLAQKGALYVTDPSNSNPGPRRNDIRLNILPLLKKRQPGLLQILGSAAATLREEREWMESEAADWINRQAQRGNDREIRIPLSEFVCLPEGKKAHVIRQALRMSAGHLHGITTRHIEAVKKAAQGDNPHAQIALPGDLSFKRGYECLVFSVAARETPKSFSLLIHHPGVFYSKEARGTIRVAEYPREDVEPEGFSERTAFFDAAEVPYPLTVRSFKEGDRFIPLGMRGHKKLKNFFIDCKIPLEERKTIPIFLTGDRIFWVCGLRMDDRFKVTPRTKTVLQVEFQTSLSG